MRLKMNAELPARFQLLLINRVRETSYPGTFFASDADAGTACAERNASRPRRDDVDRYVVFDHMTGQTLYFV